MRGSGSVIQFICRRCRLFGGLVDVQIPVQLVGVLSNLTIVGQQTVAQSVGETKTVIGLNDGSSRSLQPLLFPIEFVDQHQLLGRLHRFCIGRLPGTGEVVRRAAAESFDFLRMTCFMKRLPKTYRTGGSSTLRKPPFCRIFRFLRSDVFLVDRALRSLRLQRRFFI